MKTTIISAVLYCCLASMGLAQQTPPAAGATLPASKHVVQSHESEVPSIVTKSFTKDVPGVLAGWTINGPRYMADYCDSLGFRHMITYDPDGKALNWQEEVTGNSYPAVIEDYLKKAYPGERITIWRSRDADDKMFYYFTRGAETIRFNSEGNYESTTQNKLVK